MIEPFFDAHVHFWDHAEPGLRWRFLEPDFDHPRLKNTQSLDAPRYGPDELRTEAGAQVPDRVVHVQCAMADDPVVETRFLDGLAAAAGWPDVIVGGARLRESGVAGVLDRHAESVRVRGVRDLTIQSAVEPDDVGEAFDAASRLGLSVELMLPPEHYGSIVRLAARWPDVTIVLGHAGQPALRSAEYLAGWASKLAEVAAATERVVLKISAVASSADPHWTVDSVRPVVLAAIEAFGPSRCMLASNWPIDRLYGSYVALVGAYRATVAELEPAERAAVLAGTATAVYDR
ncbi:MAG: amidohydrolase family protein [Actinobacteria bacterium]|nr:amidohydrolase family protein [Actinomycetota bacterium]